MVTELFIRRRKLNNSLIFNTQFYFAFPKKFIRFLLDIILD